MEWLVETIISAGQKQNVKTVPVKLEILIDLIDAYDAVEADRKKVWNKKLIGLKRDAGKSRAAKEREIVGGKVKDLKNSYKRMVVFAFESFGSKKDKAMELLSVNVCVFVYLCNYLPPLHFFLPSSPTPFTSLICVIYVYVYTPGCVYVLSWNYMHWIYYVGFLVHKIRNEIREMVKDSNLAKTTKDEILLLVNEHGEGIMLCI
jgi:hypothetical protein